LTPSQVGETRSTIASNLVRAPPSRTTSSSPVAIIRAARGRGVNGGMAHHRRPPPPGTPNHSEPLDTIIKGLIRLERSSSRPATRPSGRASANARKPRLREMALTARGGFRHPPRGDRSTRSRGLQRRHRLLSRRRPRPPCRRTGVTSPHLPRTSRPAQGPRPTPPDREGPPLRPIHGHRGHPGRLLDRYRGRGRSTPRLRLEGAARTPQRPRPPRGRAGSPGPGRLLPRRPRGHPPPGRRRSGQRLQLPVLGSPGEAGPGVSGRPAHHRQAGHPHGVPDRGHGPSDRRLWHPP